MDATFVSSAFLRRIHQSAEDSFHKGPVMLNLYVVFGGNTRKLLNKQFSCLLSGTPSHLGDFIVLA